MKPWHAWMIVVVVTTAIILLAYYVTPYAIGLIGVVAAIGTPMVLFSYENK